MCGVFHHHAGCAGGFPGHVGTLASWSRYQGDQGRVFTALLGGLGGGSKIKGYARVDGGHEGSLAGEGAVIFLEEGRGAAVESRVRVRVDEEARDGLVVKLVSHVYIDPIGMVGCSMAERS